jgi:epoxyqueuosine reductase QueG
MAAARLRGRDALSRAAKVGEARCGERAARREVCRRLCGQLQHGSSVHSTHPERAWISRYAWGRDYHDTLQEKLRELARWMEENAPAKTRTYVDTGPLTERVFARYAVSAGLERTHASLISKPDRGCFWDVS